MPKTSNATIQFDSADIEAAIRKAVIGLGYSPGRVTIVVSKSGDVSATAEAEPGRRIPVPEHKRLPDWRMKREKDLFLEPQ